MTSDINVATKSLGGKNFVVFVTSSDAAFFHQGEKELCVFVSLCLIRYLRTKGHWPKGKVKLSIGT